MKKFNKALCVILVLAMLLGMAACGNDPTANNNTANTDNTENTATENTNTQTNDSGNEAYPSDLDPRYFADNPDHLKPQTGGILNLYRTGNPTSLFTIYKSVNAPGYVNECVERLLTKDPLTNEISPKLADFEWDKENNTITFFVKDNIYFHDGSKLTAEVVKWNYEFYMENGMGANIYNPTIEIVDEMTLKLTFDKFHLDTLEKFASVDMYSKKAYDDNGLDYCINHPVGTGAFIFQEYIPDNKIVYTRNDNYWDEGLPYLDGVVVKIISEANGAMTAYDNGEIDFFMSSRSADIETMKSLGYEDISQPYFNGYTMTTVIPCSTVESDPFYKTEVRQAVFNYGIDWEACCLMVGVVNPLLQAQGWTDDSLFYNQDIEDAVGFDREKALKMLADAGYADGFSTKIYATANQGTLATALQDELKNLNITAEVVTIVNTDSVRYDPAVPGIYFLAGTSAWDALTRFIPTNMSPTSKTFGKKIAWTDEYTELYNKALKAQTYEERAEYAKKAMYKLIVDEAKWRCIWMSMPAVFVQKWAHDTGAPINKIGGSDGWVEDQHQ